MTFFGVNRKVPENNPNKLCELGFVVIKILNHFNSD
jgi:hypothetical protein